MKRLLFLLVFILTLGLLFTACDSDDDEDKTPQTPENEESVVKVYDEKMNLVNTYTFSDTEDNTIDTSVFQKVGYKFEGVYVIGTETMLFNENGMQSPAVIIDKTFKGVAKYSPIKYQLLFIAGEGKLEVATDYVRSVSYGEALGVFPSVIIDGKEFDGWFDESGNQYSAGMIPVSTNFTESTFPLESEAIKLYAHYSEKYYNVTLMYQNGSTDVSIKVKHGDKLPDLTKYYVDDGSRVVTGFGVSSSAAESFDQAVYTDLELYAIWNDYKNVYFSYTEDDIRKVKVFRNGSLAVLPDAEREGYVFEGWYSNELLSGSKVTNATFGSLSTIYYAKWSVGTYTIKFLADGKLVSQSSFSMEDRDIFVPPVPAKKHYSGAWESYELEYKDITVSAVYEPEEFKLTLMSGSDYTYQNVKYGEDFTLSIPKRRGYDFDGWFYGEEKITDSNGVSLNPYTYESAVTLTANWISSKCTLYFESNGGTALDSVLVDYGKPYTLTAAPERDGYYFGGWFDETLVNEYIGTITLTKDAIVYAKWIKSTAIYDVEGLMAIADNPYGNYHLTANINLRGEVWEPLESFAGILNGNGYKIYNFALKKDNADLGFIIKNTGTIKNLTLTNIEFSSTIEGDYTCSVSAFCSYNEGNLINVFVDSVNSIVNIKSSSVNNTISIGTLVGENSGKITFCTTKSSLTLNTDLSGHYSSYTTNINVGGLCGKDTGDILIVKSTWNITIKEYVKASSGGSAVTWKAGWKNVYLTVGAICGSEHGNLTDAIANFKGNLYSNAGGTNPNRYTYIGGIVGSVKDVGAVSNCYSYGICDLTRVGKKADSCEFYSGGIVGKVENGTVNNCASSLNLTLTEGYGGYMAGIAGCISQSGRVSNVAYYGTVKTIAYSGGYFTGLVGLVEGVFTKAYFHGKVDTDSDNVADVVAKISSSGSVSKTIDNGNMRVVFVENSGAANDNYVIGVDYGADILLDISTMFETLCLFEADIWSVDSDNGLYLIAFPEFSLQEFEI